MQSTIQNWYLVVFHLADTKLSAGCNLLRQNPVPGEAFLATNSLPTTSSSPARPSSPTTGHSTLDQHYTVAFHSSPSTTLILRLPSSPAVIHRSATLFSSHLPTQQPAFPEETHTTHKPEQQLAGLMVKTDNPTNSS
ncbi:hypothetical protein L2E82_20417 [Cichorium intybus]|uniref:Uncharacterized protein n=1 Tax=Cichorium intybus TaxID=13427 RepID=A0ACB9DUA4_CICIN|nr:hypothetical protein L2E82_20417 [Cichorium intybus]